MPGVLMDGAGDRKRKRAEKDTTGASSSKSRKAPKSTTNGDSTQAQILALEAEILESREHYNNIVKLQEFAGKYDVKPKSSTLAAVALCRVFCRLTAGENLVKRKDANEADAQVVQWLRARLSDYVKLLISWFGSPDAAQESTALTLLMRIVKEETSQGSKRSEQAWRTPNATFSALMVGLLEADDAEAGRQEFVEKYVEEHDDVRFYALLALKQYFTCNGPQSESRVGNALEMLAGVEGIPDSEDQLEDWYGEPPSGESRQLVSLNVHRKMGQEAWLSIFRSPLSRDHRKTILSIMSSNVLPWFTTRIELLTDFLTDSFNEGGSLSLLALSGIFHLMAEKNLDYPDFYTKLYSLLDQDILHSKHRSRFFRLLDTFMGSSHLPAAMVASFIKRLARLALQAPPGAIVWIVPWTYNMIKRHPACGFMLHRTFHPAHLIYARRAEDPDAVLADPFSFAEADPTLTNAIESSLWELETLASHYHPNVATLAKIMSEQFTKRDYQLEDFLDHSYATLIDAELGKAMKKTPVVEWEIPKRIVTAESGQEPHGLGSLLHQAMQLA
ncbi:Hypothetical protein R9X50_00062000 [Acrodontium crateriforme]|uniref:CCAAT-binding factor domain-containing protein n=1 Tax=Acrodontium crateriforme TaxID=150365 RepID=A0AAQ3R7B2_9PEZI|nr:Hypothetical protein R9X50_00062000 [Acrodontium crateriforme]